MACLLLADNVNLNPVLGSYLRFVRHGAVRYFLVLTLLEAHPCLATLRSIWPTLGLYFFWHVHHFPSNDDNIFSGIVALTTRSVQPTPFKPDAESANKGAGAVAASKSPRNHSTYFRGAVECNEQINK